MATSAYAAWVADGRPWKDSRPVRAVGDRLIQHGYTVYYHGNDAHLTADPPEDHTPFSATGWPGASPYPYCMALDIMPPRAGQTSKLTGRALPGLDRLAAQLLADKQTGLVAAGWLKYMNSTDAAGNVWHDKWTPGYSRTTSTDAGHIHLSCRTDYADSGTADGYDLVARTEGASMTIFGWDASHYDTVPDGARVVAEGFKFMTHKAGGDQDDPEVAAWWQAMKPYRSEVLLGAYWVLYPGNPVARADAFIARLDSQCPGWRDGPFLLQVDCEKWNNDSSTVPGKADIKAFCDRLVARMPKLLPPVYAPKWAYGDSLTGLGYPLWASAYVDGSGAAWALYPGDGSSKWGAYSGQVPAILQFTDSATIAGQTTCDADAFRGTLAQLTALVAPGWETDMLITDKTGSDVVAGRDVKNFFSDFWDLRDTLVGYAPGAKHAAIPADSPLGRLMAMPAQITQLTAAVAALNPADFAAAVIAQLPDTADPISQEEVTAAVQAAFHAAFGNAS